MAAPIRHTGGMLGRYRLLEQIGAGGMGVVYRAHDERLGRDVAIKLLTPGSIRSVVARHQVRNEAVALSRLSHPNIETIFEFDSIDECDFLVVELIPGVSLDELLSRGPLPQTLAVSLTMQLMRGLAAAHEKGIIHRDLKPSNLRLTPDSFLKILDFGIAHIGEEKDKESHDLTTETHSTVLTGTLAYMSPEQLRGAPLDSRSDIYAAGLVLYQMCVGRPPYSETGALLIDAILNRPVPSPVKVNGEVSSPLEAVILKALEKDPRKRYQSAREMLRDLEVLDAEVAAPFGGRALQLFGVTLLLLIFGLMVGLEHRRITGWVERRLHPVPANKYVAVMPFHSVTHDDTAFDEGLTEALAAKLMEITAAQSVQIVSPREIKAEHVADVSDAHRKLGVNLAVAGSLQRVEGATRINLELVDAGTLRLLRAANFTANASDAFTLQDQVIEKTVQMLEIEMHRGVGEADHGTTNPEAFRLYTRGVGFLENESVPEDVDSAIVQFRHALTLDPGYTGASAGLGLAYFEKYRLTKDPSLVEEARSACARALTLSPRSPGGNICLGAIHHGTGQYQAAVSDFETAIEADPNDDEAYRGLAAAFVELGRMQDAENTYKKAISIHPQYASGYGQLARLYRREGKYALAIAELKRAIELAPDDARHWFSLGANYNYAGDYPRSIEALQKAITIRPSYQAYSNLGLSYLALRRFPEAVASLEEAVAMGSHTIQTFGNLGRAYYFYPSKQDLARGPLEKALQLAVDDLKVNPRDADVLTLAAEYSAMLGQRNEALDYLNAALQLRPSDAETLYFAGIVQALLGERDQAVSWLRKASKRGYSRADIENALELDPLRNSPEFKSLLADAR
jgi:eukaryotic-like serine/threonine-protein kinase